MPLPPASLYFLTKGLQRRDAVALLGGMGDGAKEERSTMMISVSVEIREGGFTRRVQITAPSVKRAMNIAGGGKPGRGVRLLFPIDPEAFFVVDGPGHRKAA